MSAKGLGKDDGQKTLKGPFRAESLHLVGEGEGAI